jgi:starch phosphorylase
MVKEYVERLYTPAAHSERAVTADSYRGGKELAAWAEKVEQAWGDVHVAHVESGNVDAVPQVGDELHVRAHVALGALSPDDVKVEVVYGRARDEDRLSDIRRARLELEQRFDGQPATFAGTVRLERAGSFGYTVRVVPNSALLATPAELGLVAQA